MNDVDYQGLWREQHKAAFAIATDLEMQAPQLLRALRTEVEAAITNGTSLCEFRQSFARIVEGAA
jgi:hypothetical protein